MYVSVYLSVYLSFYQEIYLKELAHMSKSKIWREKLAVWRPREELMFSLKPEDSLEAEFILP